MGVAVARGNGVSARTQVTIKENINIYISNMIWSAINV